MISAQKRRQALTTVFMAKQKRWKITGYHKAGGKTCGATADGMY